MQLKNEYHSFVGMQRDLVSTKHPAQFLYEGRNIRLTAREDDTLLSITNEKGPSKIGLSIKGTYIGHCLLNKYLVVFSKSSGEKPDYITRIDFSNSTSRVLYNGNLGFSVLHKIEAIAYYENNNIQKIYWTDGNNPPRVINIVAKDDTTKYYNDTSFDFIPTLKLKETVSVTKQLGVGTFESGVIQYAFTYCRNHLQESNIFWTTPLYYISPSDRGASPEEKVSCSFKITITNVEYENFDYIRVYSIQRTSLNGTPIAKRVADIYLSKNPSSSTITFTDFGTSGDSIDPTELLYKGGYTIKAGTIEQKDNTLFLGNLTINNTHPHSIIGKDYTNNTLLKNITIVPSSRTIYGVNNYNSNYSYRNQLTVYNEPSLKTSTPCAGFKLGNTYRLGIQLQYKDGNWSDVLYYSGIDGIGRWDKKVENVEPPTVSEYAGQVTLPVFKGTIPEDIVTYLYSKGYRRIRSVFVYPSIYDRETICQGVLNTTLDYDNTCISSWFFRPTTCDDLIQDDGTVCPDTRLWWNLSGDSNDPATFRLQEIQGATGPIINKSTGMYTLHSPDIELGEELFNYDFVSNSNLRYNLVGRATFTKTFSDIDIQTETPTISKRGGGFVHKSFIKDGPWGIVAGLFYDDFLVDDKADDGFSAYEGEKASVKWLIYPWHATGSLNNDVTRPANNGTASAVLKKKIISNLRYATTIYEGYNNNSYMKAELFNSDEDTIIKLESSIYKGNLDTTIIPEHSSAIFFAVESLKHPSIFNKYIWTSDNTPFTSDRWGMLYSYDSDESNQAGVYVCLNTGESVDTRWEFADGAIGDRFVDLAIKKGAVRIKYKSTPHLFCNITRTIPKENNSLIIADVMTGNTSNLFGGTTQEALKENIWVPCGDPVNLEEGKECTYEYSWGDCYYQRYDCLKTYPFTREDINQIVEIGSFMLETFTNIDGRYDRNRGQLNNINMSPTNFNLINPVYNQQNNFFSYRILDEEYYNTNSFSNQITWSKEKFSGADIDLWTNITLSSTYDLDGSLGEIVSLNLFKDTLFCFQSNGISNILYNSRVQIPVSDGVPIEISNSYKVEGTRYITDNIGCTNKWLIKEATNGIYFVDSTKGHLYVIADGINNLTESCNLTSWFDSNNTYFDRVFYDKFNQDVYIVSDGEEPAICFSEKLGQFSGLYDYHNIDLLEVVADGNPVILYDSELYKMFNGDYCNFFGEKKPWYFTFISNGSDSGVSGFDKIFSNIDYRMSMYDGTMYLPFSSLDYIRVTNEYQDTEERNLTPYQKSIQTIKDWSYSPSNNLQKKFMNWRIQIPRSNKSMNRIRNTWCKITLGCNRASDHKAVLHDLNVQYYI